MVPDIHYVFSTLSKHLIFIFLLIYGPLYSLQEWCLFFQTKNPIVKQFSIYQQETRKNTTLLRLFEERVNQMTLPLEIIWQICHVIYNISHPQNKV